jgi:hypothetical protein
MSDMQLCRAQLRVVKAKPTDWESVFDRQRKNFADPGNASACASPTAALLLGGRIHLLRLLQEIPLGEEEQAAVEDGVAAYENLLSKLSDVPTPAGPTPRQLGAGLVQITSVRPALPASTLTDSRSNGAGSREPD